MDKEVSAEELANQKESSDAVFDFRAVDAHLKTCLIEGNDVDLSAYIKAYKELYNFFLILGSVFGFVATDVKNKLKILEDLLNEDQQHFATVNKMLTHERDSKLLDNSKYVSGARTLLRLHRGLNFINKFLQSVHTLDDSTKIGPSCREAYKDALEPYHTFMIRKTVAAAMHFLPTRGDFVKRMTKDNAMDVDQALAALPSMLKESGEVYNRVEKFYTDYKLHDLK